MALAKQARYQEWTAVTEASAANIGSVIQAQLEIDPPSQTFGTETIAGSAWTFDKIVHDGSAFVLLFWRFNFKV